jgi:hypothetical protein
MSIDNRGVQALASAVMLRAIKDVNFRLEAPMAKAERKTLAGDARAFLSVDDEGFVFWCDVLDAEPEPFLEAVKRRGRMVAVRADRAQHRLGTKGQ